ncbi:MAG: sporulation initiation factor Spo0A C-terminal domain-containing protein [Ruminococcus sp.]|nr:sporulation initiation factor Spo0A C-terminal domain-containing protein [Ruminococcus sp.]
MKDLEKIFRQVAKNNNTTVKNVKKEITLMIEEAMKNNSPENIEMLKSISANGTKPTPEEFIMYVCKNITFTL